MDVYSAGILHRLWVVSSNEDLNDLLNDTIHVRVYPGNAPPPPPEIVAVFLKLLTSRSIFWLLMCFACFAMWGRQS